MTRSIVLAALVLIANPPAKGAPYDFRTSAAYQSLSASDRQGLERVRPDLLTLWGALDLYADEHGGGLPKTLDELVPRYLLELPTDPFAAAPGASARSVTGYTPSKNGLGYQYRPGAAGNRAWVLMSVGLPDFPYLAERGNVGLYLSKGVWISGQNPATGSLFKK